MEFVQNNIINNKKNNSLRTNSLVHQQVIDITYGSIERENFVSGNIDFLRGYRNADINIIRNFSVPRRYVNGIPVLDNNGNPVFMSITIMNYDEITTTVSDLKEMIYHALISNGSPLSTPLISNEQLGTCIYFLRRGARQRYLTSHYRNQNEVIQIKNNFPNLDISLLSMTKYGDSLSLNQGLCSIFSLLNGLEEIIPNSTMNNALDLASELYMQYFEYPTPITITNVQGENIITQFPTIYDLQGGQPIQSDHPIHAALSIRALIYRFYSAVSPIGTPAYKKLGLTGDYFRARTSFAVAMTELQQIMINQNEGFKLVDMVLRPLPTFVRPEEAHSVAVCIRRNVDSYNNSFFSFVLIEGNTGRYRNIQSIDELHNIIVQVLEMVEPGMFSTQLDDMDVTELNINGVFNRPLPSFGNNTLADILRNPFILYNGDAGGLLQPGLVIHSNNPVPEGSVPYNPVPDNNGDIVEVDGVTLRVLTAKKVPQAISERIEYDQESKVTEFQGKLREAAIELEKNSGIVNLNNHRILYSEITTVVSNHDPITGNAEIKYEVPIQNMENNDRINVVIENDAMNGVKELLSAYSRSSYERSVENSVFTHPENISNVSNISEHTGISSIGANNIPRGVTIERSPFSVNPIHTLSYGFLFMTLLNSFSDDNS